MGCGDSKPHKTRTNPRSSHAQEEEEQFDVILAASEQDDERRIASLKRDFNDDFEMFVLNNILMCVMFFDNYDREMQRIVAQGVSKREHQMGPVLITDHKKQCIMPDSVFENVNRMVRFRRKHGPKKYMDEPLMPQRMFIIHDTVEIVKDPEDHYSEIDKPVHRSYIENSKHPGFVKLNHVEFLNTKIRNGVLSSISPADSRQDSEAYISGREILKSGISECSSPADSKPSTSSDFEDDSEYQYMRINELRMQRPLPIRRNSRNYSGGLPPNCIQEVKIKNMKFGSDDEDDNSGDLYLTRHYISSNEFMAHFRDVFSGALGEALGFSPEELERSTYNTGAIFCQTTDDFGSTVNCEVVPSVLNPWPDLDDWASRSRNTVIDRITTTRYVWPSGKMIEEILKLHSVVIPRGFLQKRGENVESKHEWEVAFPKAEKHMHTRMSHAQTRCFLFIVTLHKTFIEPLTEQKGLLVDHLRTLLFWECEKNYRQWLDDKLGAKLIKVLQTLYNSLAKEKLNDYFIDNKNLFENIPGKFLRKAQEKIHNIIETPVVHFLCALRNLSCPSDRFYPTLNYDELYSILYTKNPIKHLNPELFHQVEEDMAQTKAKKKLTPEQYWEMKRMEETRKRVQEQKKKEQQENEKTNLSNQPRVSTDSIDLRWAVKGQDPIRATVIISFFIEHFIKIAEVSTRNSNKNQALFYLKNAYYLSKVQEDLPSGAIKAHELQLKIKNAEDTCKRQSSALEMSTSNASLNVRHSAMMGETIQLRTKTVDRNNLTQRKNMPVNDAAAKQKQNWAEVNVANNSTKKIVKTTKFNTKVDIHKIK